MQKGGVVATVHMRMKPPFPNPGSYWCRGVLLIDGLTYAYNIWSLYTYTPCTGRLPRNYIPAGVYRCACLHNSPKGFYTQSRPLLPSRQLPRNCIFNENHFHTICTLHVYQQNKCMFTQIIACLSTYQYHYGCYVFILQS